MMVRSVVLQYYNYAKNIAYYIPDSFFATPSQSSHIFA